MRPCDGRRASATRRDLLAGGPIEVRSEPVELYARSTSERGDGRLGAYESMPTQRGKLAHWDPIPGHDEGLALIQLPHNLATVVAKLTLSDLSSHTQSVARVLRLGCGAGHLKRTRSCDTGRRREGVGSAQRGL